MAMKRLMGAVDIGGTKIAVGIVDETGKVLTQKRFKTNLGTNGAVKSMEMLLSILKNQCKEQGTRLELLRGIGIVCAGPVDTMKGIVNNPYTLPGWERFPIVQYLYESTNLEVHLENDANGALMGEVLLQGLQNNRALMITFGTGIGVALWEAGKLYCAGDGYHPEMGHVIVASEDRGCYCHHAGCFESMCSGSALNARAAEKGFIDFDGLFQAYREQDQASIRLIQSVRRELKNGVWNLALLFKPDTIILGGGLMEKYFAFAAEAIQEDLGNRPEFLHEFTVIQTGKKYNSALAGISMMFQ